MSKIDTLIKMIGHDKSRIARAAFLNFAFSKLSHIVPDSIYLKWQYRINMKRRLNLNAPRSFNEKLQWLKLHDRKEVYSNMVDKYEAKELFAKMFGKQHIIDTYGVWDSFDDINIDSLPDQFVLKCTHDSGSIIICRDKSKLNWEYVRGKIEKAQKTNGYWYAREWPYKNVKPRIIAEKYMEMTKNGETQEMIDYKFYCFSGEPKYLYVSQGLENHETASISFLTLDWKFAPFKRSDYQSFAELPEKPAHFDRMVEMAKRASQDIPFLRVDLYEVGGNIYFSEFTFSPNGGYMPFYPEEWDDKIGNLIKVC